MTQTRKQRGRPVAHSLSFASQLLPSCFSLSFPPTYLQTCHSADLSNAQRGAAAFHLFIARQTHTLFCAGSRRPFQWLPHIPKSRPTKRRRNRQVRCCFSLYSPLRCGPLREEAAAEREETKRPFPPLPPVSLRSARVRARVDATSRGRSASPTSATATPTLMPLRDAIRPSHLRSCSFFLCSITRKLPVRRFFSMLTRASCAVSDTWQQQRQRWLTEIRRHLPSCIHVSSADSVYPRRRATSRSLSCVRFPGVTPSGRPTTR